MSLDFWVAVLLSIIMLGAVIGWRYLERRRIGPAWLVWFHEPVRVIVDAVFVVLLAHVVIELPIIRGVIRQEMEKVIAYPKRLRDPDYLKERFGAEDRRAFRAALTRSLAVRQEVAGEDTLLDKLVYPVLDGVVRTDLEISRRQSLTKSPAGEEYFFVREKTAFTEHADSVTIPLRAELDHISGVPDSQLCKLVSFELDGRPLVPAPQLRRTLAAGKVVFDGRRRIATIDHQAHLEWVMEKRIPVDDQWISYVSVPTRGVNITFRYAGKWEPRLYLFGMGSEDPGRIKVVDQDEGLRQWRYDGWLFRKHGWVVTWPHPQTAHRQ